MSDPVKEQLLPAVIAAIVSALITAWVSHRLHRDTSAKDRLRAARSTLRRLIAQARAETGFYAFAAHQEFVSLVSDMRHTLVDDLRPWNRRRFERACDDFLTIPGAALQARIEPLGLDRGDPEQQQRNDQALRAPTAILVEKLTAILSAV